MARRRRARRSWVRALVLAGLAVGALALGRSPSWSAEPERKAPAQPRRPVPAEPSRPRPQAAPAAPRAGAGEPAFRSLVECEDALRKRAKRGAAHAVRVGTWNLRWFPRGTASGRDPDRRTDVRWLACAIASLDVDVLAVQEVMQDPEGRAALLDLEDRLDQLTGGRWRAELDACPAGRQHVGLLFDTRRVEVDGAGEVGALNPGDDACDGNLRPGFGAHVRFANGADAHVIAVHLDSGPQRRDFDNRRRSLARLEGAIAELRRRRPDRDVIVLGDFNTMGCAKCAPASSASQELAELDAALAAPALARLDAQRSPLCSSYYRGHAALLDHVLVSRATPGWAHARLELHGPCAALACGALSRRAERPAAFARLSDHCPVTAALTRR